MITLPNNKQWTQSNLSDAQGSLVGTFNVDLTANLGRARVRRTIQTTRQTVNIDLTNYPVGFKVFDSGANIWTAAGSSGVGKTHKSASASANSVFLPDTTTGFPTDCDSTLSDIEVTAFGGATSYLCVTANSKLYYRSNGNWSNTSLLAGGGPWMMTAYASRLYVAISGISKIVAATNPTTGLGTAVLTLDDIYRPTFLRSSSNRIWIGTRANTGKGYIFEWDGASAQVTRAYRLESQGAIACVIKNDLPWVIDTEGRLLTYAGGSFREVDRLPGLSGKLFLQATNPVNDRFIHPNGMTLNEGKINMLIRNEIGDAISPVSGSIPEFCPSGIWEYDENIGLYHKNSLSYLFANTNILTDYGQNRLAGVGALSEMKLPNVAANDTGNLLAGATVYTNASLTDAGIFTDDTFENVSGTNAATQASGYLVTPWIDSPNVQDVWQKIFVTYKQFLTATDKIILKYRTTEAIPLEISITWVTTSKFTTTTNVLGREGQEVEVTQGTGSGKTAHITTIDVAGSVYTVNLDDTFTGVTTGTAKARLQAWVKLGEITGQTAEVSELSIGAQSPRIQLKCCMLFTGKNELHRLALVNQGHQPAE